MIRSGHEFQRMHFCSIARRHGPPHTCHDFLDWQTALRKGSSAGMPSAEATTEKARAVVLRTYLHVADIRTQNCDPAKCCVVPKSQSTLKLHATALLRLSSWESLPALWRTEKRSALVNVVNVRPHGSNHGSQPSRLGEVGNNLATLCTEEGVSRARSDRDTQTTHMNFRH